MSSRRMSAIAIVTGSFFFISVVQSVGVAGGDDTAHHHARGAILIGNDVQRERRLHRGRRH